MLRSRLFRRTLFIILDRIMYDTESIKYIGSKKKLLPYIYNIVKDLDVKYVLDGFSGSTRVSQLFANMGLFVHSNDIAIYSAVLAHCYLKADKSRINYYKDLIDHLNTVKPINGYFTQHYYYDLVKHPFQLKNLKKLDGIREEIDNLRLGTTDKCVALTALLLGLDKVDNTLGHFASYLREYSKRSYDNLLLEVPKIIGLNNKYHKVFNKDIKEITNRYDLVYLDPPYGSSNNKMPSSRVRYGSYYHFYTTVIKNDKPELFGKAGRPISTKDSIACSDFEDYKIVNGRYQVHDTFVNLFNNIKSKYILLSYSSTGRLTKQELLDIIADRIIAIYEIPYKKNIMANMVSTNEWINNNQNKEYLFLMRPNHV